ncbi:MAG TPA: glutathione S-transferase [Polyangiaceae bacterium]|jgi:glutathione S-transferase
MPELLGLPYSPWSEKARWALEVRRVPFRSRHYQPIVGEPALRLKLRRPFGNVTVPVLTTDDGRVLADSWDIARWADERGEGPRLFPAEHEAKIRRFVELSERGLGAGRTSSLKRMLEDDEALAEMVPRGLRKALGKAAARVGEFGIRRTLRKYSRSGAGESPEAVQRQVLGELRAALSPDRSRSGTLLGSFTFADIAMAQVLVYVEPPSSGLKLAPASRKNFGDPALREAYGDLVRWRDDLYAAHRLAPAKA